MLSPLTNIPLIQIDFGKSAEIPAIRFVLTEDGILMFSEVIAESTHKRLICEADIWHETG